MVILRLISSPGELYQRLLTEPWGTSCTPYNSEPAPSIMNILVRVAISLVANALLGAAEGKGEIIDADKATAPKSMIELAATQAGVKNTKGVEARRAASGSNLVIFSGSAGAKPLSGAADDVQLAYIQWGVQPERSVGRKITIC